MAEGPADGVGGADGLRGGDRGRAGRAPVAHHQGAPRYRCCALRRLRSSARLRDRAERAPSPPAPIAAPPTAAFECCFPCLPTTAPQDAHDFDCGEGIEWDSDEQEELYGDPPGDEDGDKRLERVIKGERTDGGAAAAPGGRPAWRALETRVREHKEKRLIDRRFDGAKHLRTRDFGGFGGFFW